LVIKKKYIYVTDDTSEQVVIEGGITTLLNLAGRKLPSTVQSGSKLFDDVNLIQATAARTISYLATNRIFSLNSKKIPFH